jgi:hypothetical protein
MTNVALVIADPFSKKFWAGVPPLSYQNYCIKNIYVNDSQNLAFAISHFVIELLPFDYLSNQKQQDSVNDIISLLEVIDTENSDIDHVLSKVNNIYIKAASNTMIFKTRGSQEPV